MSCQTFTYNTCIPRGEKIRNRQPNIYGEKLEEIQWEIQPDGNREFLRINCCHGTSSKDILWLDKEDAEILIQQLKQFFHLS